MYLNKEDNYPKFKAWIENDTLCLENDGEISKYINYSNKSNSVGYSIIGKVNLNYVLSRISKDSNLYKILKITDSTNLWCNYDIGIINTLTTKMDCDNNWIFEIKNDTINIYKFNNACHDKSSTFVIQKTLVHRIPLLL